jgi:hypothetical protein
MTPLKMEVIAGKGQELLSHASLLANKLLFFEFFEFKK